LHSLFSLSLSLSLSLSYYTHVVCKVTNFNLYSLYFFTQ
jgi:hypothetical protein